MTTLFERVPFKTEAPKGPLLLHIYRHNGRALATVTQYSWYAPDDPRHDGYAELDTSPPRPADEVVARFWDSGAEVALESEDLWNPQWGRLREQVAS